MFVAGFQYVAFQTPANNNGWLGGGGYVHPYIKYADEEAQREKVRKEKSELERLESVLRETERKKELAEKARLKALSEKRAKALARAEAEFIQEINRLLMVRAELIRRIKEDEAILIIMIMSRKRLRAG